VHSICVAGPVLRIERYTTSSPELKALYDRMEQAANTADVTIDLPLYNANVAKLPRSEFTKAMKQRVWQADSLVALIDAPGGHERTNLSVAGEAYWASQAGKPVVIAAENPAAVPAQLLALTPFRVERLAVVDFVILFRQLADTSEEPMPPLAAV
jgi:hypothetical protein